MFEAEDPLGADVPSQADPDVGTGEAEDETLSAGDIDAAVPEGGELSLGEDEAPAEAEPGKNIPEPGELLLPSTVEAVVTYRFIVGDEVVATQTAQDGDEVIRPEDPAAPEGMVFAGWFYMDGEAGI